MTETARILVLEDDKPMRELLKGILEDEGFSVEAASNGEEAVEVASFEQLDLVILDIRMEGINGLDALALMRNHLNGAQALVITGYASEADSIRALRLGVSDYLRKPFDLSLFLQRVHQLLKQTKLKRLQQKREDSLKHLLRWSTTTFLNTIQGKQVPENIAESIIDTFNLASNMAELSGFISPEIEEVSIGSALLSLSSVLKEQNLSENSTLDQPNINKNLAQEILNKKDGFAFNIATLAFESMTQGKNEQFSDNNNVTYDPLLMETLSIALANQQTKTDNCQDLLNLGTALLHTGDIKNAQEAFRRAISQGQGICVIQSWISLAHIARINKNKEQALESLTEAVKLAESVGPAQLGKTLFKAGTCLMLLGEPTSEEYLQRALQVFTKLDLQPFLARTQAALANFNNTSLEKLSEILKILLKPEYEPYILEDLQWLWPVCLKNALDHEKDSVPCWEESMLLLVKRHNQSLINMLNKGGLLGDEKRLAAQYLIKIGSLISEDTISVLKSIPDQLIQQTLLKINCQEKKVSLPLLCCYTFGIFKTLVGGVIIPDKDWRTAKTKSLFAFLAANPEGLTEDTIIEEFWPDNVESARQNLYSATSQIRRIFKKYYPKMPNFIERVHNTLRINPLVPLWMDLREVIKLNGKGETQGKINALQQITELAQEPFLSNCYFDWAQRTREKTNSIKEEALNILCQHYLSTKLFKEALECAKKLKTLDPYSEIACETAINACICLKHSSQAIRFYNDYCKVIKEELGAEPSVNLVKLYYKAKMGIE